MYLPTTHTNIVPSENVRLTLGVIADPTNYINIYPWTLLAGPSIKPYMFVCINSYVYHSQITFISKFGWPQSP